MAGNTVLYGFENLKDVFGERVNTVGVDVVADAIGQSVAEHERQMSALLDLFVVRTQQYKYRYQSTSDARLQPLDNNGNAAKIKPAGYYEVAYPIQLGAAAWGADYVSQIKMTVGEANRLTAMLLEADMRWLRDHIIAGLVTNVTWAFEDPEFGALTIQPLANGDAVKYMVLAGADTGAVDTHFLAQSGTIDDGSTTNPFPVIFKELMEHPENGGQVVVLAASDLIDDISNLDKFRDVPDDNIVPSGAADRLAAIPDIVTPGVYRGYAHRCHIFEWGSMPSGYMVALTTEGAPALAMRQEPEPELQGFRQVAVKNNHPFLESQWHRRAGFGAWNRVGAVVYRIGNASYAIPTGYTSPML